MFELIFCIPNLGQKNNEYVRLKFETNTTEKECSFFSINTRM